MISFLFVFLAFLPHFSCQKIVEISDTSFMTCSLTKERKECIFYLNASSIAAVFPSHKDFSIDVFRPSDNNETIYQLFSTIDSQISSSFGVYFPNGGKIIIRALRKTEASIYFIVSPRKCHRFFISSYQKELFFASKQQISKNLTIENNQNVCFSHIANSNVNLSINYSTEESYDLLYLYRYGSSRLYSADTQFTGDGMETFTNNNSNITSFIWHSDPTTLSNFFDIRLDSRSTLSEFKVNFSTISKKPIILTDDTGRQNYNNANIDIISSSGEGTKSSIALAVAAFSVFSIVIIVFALYVIFRKKAPRTELADDTQSLTEETNENEESLKYSVIYPTNNSNKENDNTPLCPVLSNSSLV